jgi:phage replication-related protein YjqB (UPF0714/DUF867 family)
MPPGPWIIGRRPKSFAGLERRYTEGTDFTREVEDRGSSILVASPHGGGIEPGSSEIARALAGRAHSLYSLEGIRPSRNEVMHLTSTLFDDPVFLRLAAGARIVVSVHGCDGSEPGVFAGGLHEDLKSAALDALRAAGFRAEQDRDGRSGSDPRNICNRGRLGMGLQLEFTLGLRRLLFPGLRRPDRETTTPVFQGLVETLQGMLAGFARAD